MVVPALVAAPFGRGMWLAAFKSDLWGAQALGKHFNSLGLNDG